MKRHAAHRPAVFHPGVSAGQHQVQLTGSNLGVLKKHFIKVAQTIKNQGVLIILFYLEILLHHRRILFHTFTSKKTVLIIPSFFLQVRGVLGL